ncbi:MAG: sigma-70 family RNA polymerase sigma factor [Gammaproteobacteria bacterium]|nr:MAG: sigma-70 family RNA polymerase sigma factor [Gammaproteobacteria bacterium]
MRPAVNKVPTVQLRGELGARFSAPLMSFFLRRLKDRSQAEDLTQEVLLRVLRACGGDAIENADGYVFKTAVNLLKDQARRALRHGTPHFLSIEDALDGELQGELVEGRSPERVLLSEDALGEVLAALKELGELTRNIFILFRLESMKQKDIAALYGISQSTVEKHVMKAVLHLATRCGRT